LRGIRKSRAEHAATVEHISLAKSRPAPLVVGSGNVASSAMQSDPPRLRTIRARRADESGCRPGVGRRVFETAMQTSRTAAVDLSWIPLGAGGFFVRFNGRVFEVIEAAREHRQRCDLYHAALVVELDGDRYTIEVAPSPDADEASRGAVATGAVGSRFLGWLRLFRYEVRCWRGGSIPDLGEAVGGPHRLSSDPRVGRRLLDLVATVPRPVWGRDELKAGEMWNSNSMIAWLIATAGLSTDLLRPPPRGRAPGWCAGLEVAGRVPVSPSLAEHRGQGPWSSTEPVCGGRPMNVAPVRGRLRSMFKPSQREFAMTSPVRRGGIAASIVLIALGIGAVVIGIAGRDTVRSDLAREQIVGTPDSAIPGQKVDTGGEAKEFAAVMRKHTLEATGGQTYSQMGRFLDKSGKPTSDDKAAAVDGKSGQPVENPARNIWISSTAFQTALNTAYFAESVATFVIVMGVALLLVGTGFLILTIRLLKPKVATARTVRTGAPAVVAS
jgi:hypothetical protein